MNADCGDTGPAPAALMSTTATMCGIAGVRGVRERTGQRDWAKARVLLHGLLNDSAVP